MDFSPGSGLKREPLFSSLIQAGTFNSSLTDTGQSRVTEQPTRSSGHKLPTTPPRTNTISHREALSTGISTINFLNYFVSIVPQSALPRVFASIAFPDVLKLEYSILYCHWTVGGQRWSVDRVLCRRNAGNWKERRRSLDRRTSGRRVNTVWSEEWLRCGLCDAFWTPGL